MNILTTISKFVIATAISLNIIAAPIQTQETPLGADIPTTPALFDSYLASGISKSDTSLTLASATLRNGQTLSGYSCFVIDVNQPTVEYVCGTTNGTSVTGLSRGVDVLDPTSSSTNLAYAHRRFASISISDYPTIQLLVNRVNTIIASGTQNYIAADEGHIGYVQLATNNQAASSTLLGSTGARVILGANLTSSTYNAGSSYVIPVTKSDNTLDQGYIPATITKNLTLSGTTTLANTTYIGSTNALDIGKTVIVVATTTSTSTITIPSGITKVKIEMVGGGNAGTGVSGSGGGRDGGSAGSYLLKSLQITGTTTLYARAGSPGIGVSGSSGIAASSSVVFVGGNATTTLIAGGGGVASTGGDLNVQGATGDTAINGADQNGASTIYYSGNGAPSFYGGGGVRVSCQVGAGGSYNGNVGSAYGSGGSGATSCGPAGSAATGGNGMQGIVIITY